MTNSQMVLGSKRAPRGGNKKNNIMVNINQIQEKSVNLLLNNEIVGKITSGLQLADVCVQIKQQQLSGYSVQDKDKIFPIDKDGRVYSESTLYPLLGQLLRKLI